MNFTFKKYIIKNTIINMVIVSFYIAVFYYYFFTVPYIAYYIFIIGIISLLRILYQYILIITFIHKHNKKKIKDIEMEINNYLLKYSNYVLTSNYIFNLKNFTYINYDEIICINQFALSLNSFAPGHSTLGLKQIIYLKNGNNIKIKTDLTIGSNKLILLIKKKNPDVFIGDINEYKKEKNIIEHLKKVKDKTRIQ